MANGFRNDCEERWACFFTEMGWLWDYHTDDYVNAVDGLCYSPTFHVEMDDGHYDIEIREHETDDISTVEQFCAQTNAEVIVITGMPTALDYNWFIINSWSEFDEYGRYDKCVWDDADKSLRCDMYSGEFDIVPVSHWIGARYIDAVTVALYQYVCEGEVA